VTFCSYDPEGRIHAISVAYLAISGNNKFSQNGDYT
jgi:hypothetical protein